jgi:hypothetical protein
VTTVPFHFGRRHAARTGFARTAAEPARVGGNGSGRMPEPPRPAAPRSSPTPAAAAATGSVAGAATADRATTAAGADGHEDAGRAARVTGSSIAGTQVPPAAGSGAEGGEGGTQAMAPVEALAWRDGITPIGDVRWRDRVTIAGRVQTLRILSSGGSSTLEAVVEDDTGAMSIVFTGRKQIGGLEVGTRLRAQGMAAEHRRRLAILNPTYALIADRH